MTPFNNELQVGQLALIINVEYPKNSHFIGTTIIIESLISAEEAKEMVFESNGHAYASHIRDGEEKVIRQAYLMPLPPLGDVYDEEMFDEFVNLQVRCP